MMSSANMSSLTYHGTDIPTNPREGDIINYNGELQIYSQSNGWVSAKTAPLTFGSTNPYVAYGDDVYQSTYSTDSYILNTIKQVLSLYNDGTIDAAEAMNLQGMLTGTDKESSELAKSIINKLLRLKAENKLKSIIDKYDLKDELQKGQE